jgi:hypothetical protein
MTITEKEIKGEHLYFPKINPFNYCLSSMKDNFGCQEGRRMESLVKEQKASISFALSIGKKVQGTRYPFA